MSDFLKNHPFPVEAFFTESIVLTFAIPKAELEHLIPECFSLDTFEDKWAFIAVAMVQTKSLRPKGFPQFLGHDFFLTGYRIFTKYIDSRGKRLRGLYILKSETDKRSMQILGNIFTHYKYTTTDIRQERSGNTIHISSELSGFNVELLTGDAALPEGSPFHDWKEARRYAGPLPFTFSYDKQKKKVLIIEGVRQDWVPQPISVIHQHFSFIEHFRFTEVRLANAFIIRNIPYYWKKGKTEIWKP